MTQSYLHVIKSIELFAQQHLQVQRFICDFRDYIPNHIEKAESFPILYVTLDSVTNSPNINTYDITVGCVVKQNVDRGGIKSDLNNCERILSDLYVWLRDGDLSIDVGNEPNHTTLNNEFLSGEIGLEGSFEIIVDGSVLCDIPFEDGIPSDYPVCSDAYYEVRNLEGELLDSGSIGSGAFKGIVVDCSGGCPDGSLTDEDGNYLLDEDGNCISGEGCAYVNYVVKYEDDTPIESGSVESGGSIEVIVPNCPIPEPCEDADVQINGVLVSTVESGGMVNISVENESGTPLGELVDGYWVVPNCPTPEPCEDATAVLKDTDGNTISTTAIPSGGTADITAPDWVRPFDWLPMPTVTSAEQKFVGLHAVIEDSDNYCAFRFTTSAGDYQVDWGDGVIETFASNVTAEHQYNFDTYDVGNTTLSTRGYKQAMIVVTPVSGNLTICNFQLRYVTSPVQNQLYSTGFLDMILSMPNAIIQGQSIVLGGGTQVRHSYCERVQILNIGACTIFTDLFREFRALQTFSLPDTTQITLTNSMFLNCNALKRVPLFNTENVTSFATMFNNANSLPTIPLFNTAKVTIMNSMFSGCSSLQSVPLLDTSKATNMNGLFNSCFSLNSIPALSTASITPSAGTDFANFGFFANSLNRCQVVFARQVSFSNCQLSRDAIVEIFTNLVDRTSTTSAEINITNNWGASALSTADREIATNKNWTITG